MEGKTSAEVLFQVGGGHIDSLRLERIDCIDAHFNKIFIGPAGLPQLWIITGEAVGLAEVYVTLMNGAEDPSI